MSDYWGNWLSLFMFLCYVMMRRDVMTQVVAKGSSELVNEGKPMELGKLESKLADIKVAIKEKVKWHKTRIRCEEENHEEYGVERENAEQANVQEINFEISKIKRQIDIEVRVVFVNESE